MQYSFQEIALKETEKISNILTKEGFSISLPVKKLYNYEITVNTVREQVKLLVFFGKKGIKKVLQGNEETALYRDLKKIVFGPDLFEEKFDLEIDYEEYIGTDESGKGDYFGPLVTAAVYVDENSRSQLKLLGVKDSKLLIDTQIKDLNKKIQKIIKHNFDVVIINPEKYNKLYESFDNLNKLLGWAHAKAIENLAQKTKCNNVISDKFGNEQIIKNELSRKKIELNLYQTPKAERYIGVAAASILARAKVIEWFSNKSREIKFEIPKGGGELVNVAAKRVLDQFDDKYLMKMIKFHFKNSKSIFRN
jgi:ribonuclease HIII